MHVRPASPRDASDLSRVATNALFDSDLIKSLNPYRHQHPECLRFGFLSRVKRRIYGGASVFAAVTDSDDPWWDGTNRVVGYASALSSRQSLESQQSSWLPSWWSWNALELQLLNLQDLITWYTFADRSLSRPAMRAYRQTRGEPDPLDNIKEKWHLDHLSIDPPYQGKGIGKTMTKHIMDIATKDGLPVTLIASEMGAPMYKKLGFVAVGMVQMGPDVASEAMVWYPPVTAKLEPHAETDGTTMGEEALL